MGDGGWRDDTFRSYSASVGRTTNVRGFSSTQGMFETVQKMHSKMNPYKVIRECCDSREHPNTIPVLLGLDVTGSMGSSCKRVASALNVIMKDIYKKYKDVEFMIGAIGDLAYDEAPIQMSQYESDIRIAEHTDNIYFEGHGGPNCYESYTAAWYFGLYHTKLDCWNRGRKGIIITLGDEPLNPYLPYEALKKVTGDNLQADVETSDLYEEVIKKFDVYHIAVDDRDSCYAKYQDDIKDSWGMFLGDNLKVATLDTLPDIIVECIDNSIARANGVFVGSNPDSSNQTQVSDTGAIRW